ncbi:dihydroorotate dehydrogenase electron transfer subunit [Thiococcus pfennigii]|jgi:dihydroorotate dehydrogenase electron transfer subunit|uniref:dihydroorotate dehydrogenase electron transfer subunit n=1 Tax=Thiococcus pfennigii TaxID=1057 RepID=UPI001905150E|nr:dihydroorotate dehydrogenase electron transfer subunit [Thiococcus pfennigii]MBK1731821.1 dihydroorotate dehydrogenase electron transfer subunit [Thiococcus pfennigii]
MTDRPHRDTIALEDARVLSQDAYPGDQRILRLAAPACARDARPGQFVHLRCDPRLALRRPLSIMRADPDAGSIELLYKVVGEGTRLLATRRPGETLSLLGPIGQPFAPHAERPRALLIGGGVGLPPMVFLADALRRAPPWRPFAILGSEVPFPFDLQPARHPIAGLPAEASAAMPLLDDWGVPNRLASRQGYPGCFSGYVTDLAEHWLAALDEAARAEVEVFACGPHPMLAAVADLARRWGLPCQVSLEEYMACGVGGCAGCVVEVRTPDGPAMKRVCVDGPVFAAEQVFFAA